MYTITVNNGGTSEIIHENAPESLRRLRSGKWADEVNCIPSFDFSMLPFHPSYSSLHDRKTIVSVLNNITNETDFEGPLIMSEEEMTAGGKVCKSCICEGYLGYLCDSIQPYHHYESKTVTEFLTALLEYHNSVTPEEKHIYLGSCDFSGDNTNSKTTAYRNTLEEIKVNLIQRIGGEVRIRKADGRLVLDFLKQYGNKCGTVIELAKNIRSLEVSSDSSNIVTRLVPLGAQLSDDSAERLTIADVNGGCVYIDDTAAVEKYGVIMGTQIFDDITLPENLIQRGRESLENNNRVRKAYAAQVLDLSLIDSNTDSIKVGNTYRFRHSVLGLDEDLRLMKVSVDIFKPYQPEVEIGDKAESITDIATRTAQLIEYELPEQKLDILASAKATATALINAGINGYVVVNTNEILIMDTPDKETATHVWRFNVNGWGYSKTGYNGTYTTAATLDGGFVADFITAGVLRGLEIVNGNDTFHVDTDGNVDAASINITGGSVNIQTGESSVDVIQLRCSSQTITQRSTVSPAAVVLEAVPNGEQARMIQIGGMGMSARNGNNTTFSVSAANGQIDTSGSVYAGGTVRGGTVSSSGNISADGNVYAEQLLYKKNGGYYNVQTLIDRLWDEVFGGGS